MSIVSRCTIGAMASKNARPSPPVSAAISLARSGEVNGPVEIIFISQSISARDSNLFANDSDQRVSFEGGGDRGREALAIDRQRAPSGHLICIRRAHDERAEPPHFPMDQADGVLVGIVGAERVRADELGQPVGLVGVGAPLRAHLVEDDRHARLRELPGGLGAGESAADDVDRGGAE